MVLYGALALCIGNTAWCVYVYVQLDYTKADNDPVGSVSIFKRQRSRKTYQESCEVGFEEFDKPRRTQKLIERGIRVGGQDFTTFSMVRLPTCCAMCSTPTGLATVTAAVTVDVLLL